MAAAQAHCQRARRRHRRPAWSGWPTASTTTAAPAPSPSGSQALAGGGFAVVDDAARRRGARRQRHASSTGGRLEAQVLRAEAEPAHGIAARAVRRAASGSARRRSRSATARRARVASFDLPLELRNQVTRIEIAGERSAGAVQPAGCALAVAPRRPPLRRDPRSRRSRCWRRSTTSSGRWRPSPRSPGAKDANLAGRRSRPHQAQRLGAHAGRHRHAAAARSRSASPSGSRRAACWCASPARASRRAATTCCPVRAAPRRAHARRRAVMVDAAAAGAVRRRQPVRRPARAARRAGQPPGAGRSRPRSART